MTEIIPAPQHAALSLPEQWQFAETVGASRILPAAYRNDPGAVLVAVNLGSAMGLGPAESLYRIHVIEGKPSASAELITSNVRRAGHKLRVRATNETATAQIIRADDPDFTYEVTWTMDDARRAGLASKDVWKKYPSSMLRSRAITECARQACPEALYGVVYTEEEARESADAEPAAPAKRESAADLLDTPATEPAPVVDRPAMGSGPDGASAQQITAIYAGMSALGYDRDGAKAVAAGLVGLESLGSMKDLTREQASTVIDRIKQRQSAQSVRPEDDEARVAELDAAPAEDQGDESFPGGAA